MSDHEGPERRRRHGRPRVASKWRKVIFFSLLGGLVAGNVWLLRRQFPNDDTRRNQAYDRALKFLTLDRDYQKAEIEFRRYLAISDDVRVRILLASALHQQGKTAEAKREYAAVIAREPGMDQAHIALAEIAETSQEYDEAFRHLAAAQAHLPTPVEAFLLQARLLADVGDLDGGIAAYRKALSHDPGSWAAHLAIADLLTFRSLLTGRGEERLAAAGSYREAELLIKSRPMEGADARLRIALARSIAGQVATLKERDLAEAVRQLRAVADADPSDPEPTLLLGQFLHNAKNDVEARRTFEDAAAKWPVPRTALALHQFYAATSEDELATKTLADAVGKHRDDAGLRIRLVGWYVFTGKMDDAERELATAETVLADDWRVHEARGDLARERARRAAQGGRKHDVASERAAALAAYRRALEGRPRSPRLKKKAAEQLIDAMFDRPAGTPMTADDEFARQCIEDVLGVNRADAEALEWHARLLLAEGRAREVADSLRGQLDAPQPAVSALRLLGVAADRSGDDRTAAAALVRVIDILAPRDAEDRRDARRAPAGDWCNAVNACVRAGRLDEAAKLSREALQAWGASPRVVFAAGATALARADTAGALSLLETARAKFPKEADIRLLYARALELAGRADEAGRELESAVADVGTDDTRLAYLDFLGRTGRLESAEQGFLAMIAASPDNPQGHLRLGDFYLALRPPKRDAALREYQLAAGLDPRDSQPWLRIADLRMQEAKTDPQAFALAETAAAKFEEMSPGDAHVDYVRGKLALLSGRTDEALERLSRFAGARPDRAAGQYYMAAALRAAGRAQDALGPMERAVRLAPSDPAMRLELATLQYELGVKAFQSGDFEAARQLFARADQGGAQQGVRFLLAGAAANAGKLDVSEAECRALLESETGNRAAMHLLAALLLRKGTRESLDEADALFRRSLALDAEDLFPQIGLGTVKFAKGMYREALADFRRVYPKTKSSPDVALAMCQCMTALSDLAGAVEFLDAEASAHPEAYDFPHLKGDFLVQVKQYDEAVKAYLEAARRAPDHSGPPLAAASALMVEGKLEDARKVLIEHQAGKKEPAMFAVALGDVLAHMNRVDEAQDQLRRALALAPGHPRALYLLGRIAENAGRTGEARKLYREAVDRGTNEADCHARLAGMLRAERDFAGSRDAWLAALRLAPRDPTYLNNLANVTAEDEKRLDEAIGYATTAAAIAPENGYVADTFGWLLYRKGKFQEAAQVLARSAALLEDVAVVQFHAGMALARSGRSPEARGRLEKALLLDPKFDGADTARSELEKLRR